MDFDALKMFMAVLEHGSVQKAASALLTSRATVRRRLDELEVTAGVQLLERGTRGVTPTAAGQTLAERGRLVLEEAHTLMTTLREVGTEPTGVLHLVLPVGLPGTLTAALLQVLMSAHSKLRLNIRVREDPLAGLLHDADVAITYGELQRGGAWQTEPIIAGPERLIATPEFLARNPINSLEDLRKHKLYCWEPPDAETNAIPLRDGRLFRVNPVVVSGDVFLLRRMAMLHNGIAFVPDGNVPLPEPPTEWVLPRLVGRDRYISLVIPTAKAHLPRVAALRKLMRDFAATVKPPDPLPGPWPPAPAD